VVHNLFAPTQNTQLTSVNDDKPQTSNSVECSRLWLNVCATPTWSQCYQLKQCLILSYLAGWLI